MLVGLALHFHCIFRVKILDFMKLFLVRHGQTEWNQQGRYQGNLDVPLDAVGRAQGERTARRLASEKVAAVYASDLSRAKETGEMIARATGAPLRINPLLRESNYGVWEGKNYAEIEADDPETYRKWTIDPLHVRPEGSEPLLEAKERMRRAIQAIRDEVKESDAIVVGHGGTLRWVVIDAVNAPLEAYLRMAPDNCSISIVEYRSRPRLLLFNDCSHLLVPDGA